MDYGQMLLDVFMNKLTLEDIECLAEILDKLICTKCGERLHGYAIVNTILSDNLYGRKCTGFELHKRTQEEGGTCGGCVSCTLPNCT